MKTLYNVTCTSKSKGTSTVCTLDHLIKTIKKEPRALEYYTFKIEEASMKQFKAKVWIHPSEGGDDYQMTFTVKAKDEIRAREMIEKGIREEGSDVVNDYQLV